MPVWWAGTKFRENDRLLYGSNKRTCGAIYYNYVDFYDMKFHSLNCRGLHSLKNSVSRSPLYITIFFKIFVFYYCMFYNWSLNITMAPCTKTLYFMISACWAHLARNTPKLQDFRFVIFTKIKYKLKINFRRGWDSNPRVQSTMD